MATGYSGLLPSFKLLKLLIVDWTHLSTTNYMLQFGLHQIMAIPLSINSSTHLHTGGYLIHCFTQTVRLSPKNDLPIPMIHVKGVLEHIKKLNLWIKIYIKFNSSQLINIYRNIQQEINYYHFLRDWDASWLQIVLEVTCCCCFRWQAVIASRAISTL